MSGQRLLLVTMTPFSVENASEGSPWMFQSLTAVGFARKLANEKSGVHGICNSRTCKYGELLHRNLKFYRLEFLS